MHHHGEIKEDTPEKGLGSRLSLILVGLMCFLPFLQWKHYYPITDFYSEWLAALIGLLAVLVNFRRLSELPLIALVFLGFFVLVWLQYALGMIPYPQQAILVSLYLLWGALLVVLGYALKRDIGMEQISSFLAWFLLSGGLLSGVAAIIQHYFSGIPVFFITPDPAETVYANLAQPNHFSDYVSLSIASLLYLAATGRIRWFAAFPMGIFLLFVLALSGSRSAWLYLVAIFLLAMLHYRREKNRTLLVGGILLIPCFLLMQWVPHIHLFAAHGTITSGERLVGKESGIRLYLWRESWMMFLNSPLLGVGFGQFAWHHFMLGPLFNDPRITGLYSNAHNIIMQLLAETGIVGILTFLGGIGFLIRRMTLPFNLHAWWLYALLLVIALHSMDEYPLWYAHFLGPFAFLLGMAEGRSLALRWAGKFSAVLLICGSYFITSLFRDYHTLEGLMYPRYQSGRPPLAKPLLFKELISFNKYTLLKPYVDYYMAQMIPIDRSNLMWKTALVERATRFSPAGIVLYRGAALLALDGRVNDASIMAERAACSDPDLLGTARFLFLGYKHYFPAEFDPLLKAIDARPKR